MTREPEFRPDTSSAFAIARISARSAGVVPLSSIEFSTARRFCVLDRERAERAHREILERYGLPRDRNL